MRVPRPRTDQIQEQVRFGEHEAHGPVDGGRVAEGLVPGEPPALVVVPPAATGDGLDRLHGGAPLPARRPQGLDVGAVTGIPQQDGAVGQEHGVERERLEAALVHAGDAQPVPGDPDVAHEVLVPRRRHGLDHTTGGEGRLPLVVLHQVVDLDELDVIGAQPGERPLQLGAGGRARALTGLGGEEDAVAVVGEPGRQPQLGVAVAGGGVDVVHPVAGDQPEGVVGPLLAHGPQGSRPEEHAGAVVPGPAEGHRRDHRSCVPQQGTSALRRVLAFLDEVG